MIRALAAALAVAGVQASVARAPAGVPVLMYHRVDAVVPRDAVGRDLTVEPHAFAAQLRFLRDRHIDAITASELVEDIAAGHLPRRAVVLTFDDGYADNATTAFPLLVKYHARGTFYVSSGFVGTPGHLSWKQMRAMQGAGMEIACHGSEHLDLSTLDRAGQLREAGGCVRRLERYLGGMRSVTYAYPAGKYDATTFSVLRGLRIRAAFTERPGAVVDLRRPYELPRRRVRHDDDVAAFGALTTQ
ncbi:MAG: polysaccharide deacetylase family protein [Candidatus Eremiobacteraeota bacterium]|nr:polysaccharide deacetylase family protein [Candidatus Eremiobacteraeota bacterium]